MSEPDMLPLPHKLRSLASQLRSIALAYEDMKFTPSEEAMTWPIAIVAEEDGEIGIWCDNKDCLLDGHNAQINTDPEGFTVAQLLIDLAHHIKRNRERQG